MPDIANLKTLSEFLGVSIDSLPDDTKPIGSASVDHTAPHFLRDPKECQDIEQTDWNDNVLGVLVFAEDEAFYYYQYPHNDRVICGMIGKKYVRSITTSKGSEDPKYTELMIDRNYFCNKPVLIERAHKEGIKGFLDFRNDDYQDVKIRSFDPSEIELEYGGSIPLSEICRIEELSDQKNSSNK